MLLDYYDEVDGIWHQSAHVYKSKPE